jgi:serine/threonine protein kinase
MVFQIENEIGILASVSHPNIVRLEEVFREQGFTFFLVQELALGVTLSKWIRRKREDGKFVGGKGGDENNVN